MSDDSTAALQGQLERAITGDVAARQRLLELTRDRLLRHARRLLHGPYARLGPFAQTDHLDPCALHVCFACFVAGRMGTGDREGRKREGARG